MVGTKTPGFVVEKISEEKDGYIEYYIKWREYPNSEITSESEETGDPQLVQNFEECLVKSKKRGEKKPKFVEVSKPRGYDRGLEIDHIVGVTGSGEDVSYLVKWQYCEELDLVKGAEVRKRNPECILQFYEKRSPFQKAIKERVSSVPEEYKIQNQTEYNQDQEEFYKSNIIKQIKAPVLKKYHCDHCKRSFRTHYEFDNHSCDLYECNICQKILRTYTGFHIHLNTHTATKPYKCSECHKPFSSKSNLKRHKKICTGPRKQYLLKQLA